MPPLPPFTPTPLFVIEVEPFCLKVTTELKSPRDPEKKIKSKKVIIVFKIEKRLSVTKIQHLNFLILYKRFNFNAKNLHNKEISKFISKLTL